MTGELVVLYAVETQRTPDAAVYSGLLRLRRDFNAKTPPGCRRAPRSQVRVYRRMVSKILTGSHDDMMIIRGVNVFPAQN